MPASASARTITALVPHSEAAVHVGVAGTTRELVEEDLFYNGKPIPERDRRGCYVTVEGGGRVPLLKSEAGWS